ncbi:two-component system regulatory protein YycI [Pseudalkalibacillus sp. SCS-8]|uniref:two-component system regulatory protein YycI n=1 Tax=Pseudalkalibacillus nanhaiensis TaxID=3115291 RepID=UPI0032DACDF4
MDWKNIKTIFIFTFLILNLYLGTEFYNKVNPDVETLKAEKLKKSDIKYAGNKLPEIKKDLTLISGTSKTFTEKDAEAFIKKNSNQTVDMESDKKVLDVTLKDPFKVSTENKAQLIKDLNYFINDYVPDSNQYKYWKQVGERNLFLFIQQQDGIPLYFDEYTSENNLSGLIEIITEVDENNQEVITGYRFSKMDLEKGEKVSKAIKAEDALRVPDIPAGTTVEKIELVYFTFINNEGWKVFVPHWHIVTEDDEWMVNVTDSSGNKVDPKAESGGK